MADSDAETEARALAAIVGRGDRSSATIARVIDAICSNGSWWEENEYYDGLNPLGGTVTLADAALALVPQLGEPAIRGT